MPDLRQLRVFIAVADQLSFTRAADSLHLTQQTVSKTVRELERELGIELLERTTREVRLTPAGAALVANGRETLRSAETAFEHARAVGVGRSGKLRVGVTPPIGTRDRAELVLALRENGDASVSLLELRPSELHDSLHAREVDLALSRARGLEDHTLHHCELRPTPMQIFVPAKHPLASRERVTLEDVDGETLLAATATGTPYTDLMVERLAHAGANVEVIEAKVTGGAALLTELPRLRAIAVAPAGTPPPAGVVGLNVDGFTLPLFVLWPAGVPPRAVQRLRETMPAPTRPDRI